MSRQAIIFQRAHDIGKEQALVVAQRIGVELETDHACQCRWEGEVLYFARAGLNGTLEVGERDVGLQIKLGFLLASFRPRIERVLSDNFDRYFGVAGGASDA